MNLPLRKTYIYIYMEGERNRHRIMHTVLFIYTEKREKRGLKAEQGPSDK